MGGMSQVTLVKIAADGSQTSQNLDLPTALEVLSQADLAPGAAIEIWRDGVCVAERSPDEDTDPA